MSDEEIEARLRRLFAAERTSAAETEAAERVGDVAAAVARMAATPRVRRPAWRIAAAVALVVVPAGIVAVTLGMRSEAPSPQGSTGATASGSPGVALPAESGPAIVASPIPGVSVSGPSMHLLPTGGLSLQQVSMVDAVHGWALVTSRQKTGASVVEVFVTSDGGQMWRVVSPQSVTAAGAVAGEPYAMAARTADEAWVATTSGTSTTAASHTVGGIFHTTDGGRSWTHAAVGQGPGRVTVVSAQVAYYVEHDRQVLGSDFVTIWRTADAGASWRLVSRSAPDSGIPWACGKSDVGWRDPANGWVGGSCPFGGIVFDVTHDGGMHWAVQRFVVPPGVDATGKGFSIEQPVFVTAKDGYAGATQLALESANPLSGSTRYLCSTHDGGTTWTCSVAPTGTGPVEVVDTGYAVAIVSDGTIESSRDDGRHWTTVGRPGQLAAGSTFVPQFLDRTTGFVLVVPPPSYGPRQPSILYRTDDGGRTLTLP